MKPYPWKCGTCREKALAPATIPYRTEVEHDGKVYDIDLPSLAVLRCANCGAVVLDDAANRKISEAFRYKARLYTPSQIREKRVALELSQKELAAFLGIAESTVSRWETGAQVQQQAMNRLLRGFFEVPAFRRYLGYDPPAEARAASDSTNIVVNVPVAPGVPFWGATIGSAASGF